MYAYIHIYIYYFIFEYIYIYVYIYIWVYIYIYICIHILVNPQKWQCWVYCFQVPSSDAILSHSYIGKKAMEGNKNILIWAISKWYPILMGKYLYVICICIFDIFWWWPGPSTCQTNPGNIKRPSQYKPLSRQRHLVFGCFLMVVAWYGFEH